MGSDFKNTENYSRQKTVEITVASIKLEERTFLIRREEIDHCKKKDSEDTQNILIISLNYCQLI